MEPLRGQVKDWEIKYNAILQERKAENLQVKMAEVNATRNLVGRDASVNEVTDWIQQAKALPRVVTH